ncbi:MAG: DUF4272 domain-containing protein [Verrucomicrobiales bacterium]|nr:DUF4272 domain-containing protein [Planctomycetota bacterium]MCP5524114.1 DUF4272 domain-containing protein [Verrucomicrobiales bacterium]
MTPFARKEETESYLRSRGVPVNPHLPCTESPEELSVATPEQVAWRVCVLSGLVARACGAPRDLVMRYFESDGLFQHTSAGEAEVVRAELLKPEQRAQFQWQVEGLWELAWVLSLIPRPDHFRTCGNELVTLVPKPGGPVGDFIERAQMRPNDELLAEADMLYRLHWAVREASLRRQRIPTGLPCQVTEERLRAINWVLSSEVTWEETDTST